MLRSTHEYEILLNAKLTTISGIEFEKSFTKIMRKLHGLSFQSVRPYGSEGDWKCDGHLVEKKDGKNLVTIFQVYAPSTSIRVEDATRKIKEDFLGAIEKWAELGKWVFVTNATGEGLPAPVLAQLNTIKQEYGSKGIEIEWWDIPEIIQRAIKMDKQNLLSILNIVPDFEGENRIWNIPVRRNPNFVGRNDELDKIHTALESGHFAALTQTLVGLGGIGKTQLAVEYAHRYQFEYDVIWWIRADDTDTLTLDFGKLAERLGLIEELHSTDRSEVVEAVRSWLSTGKNWLLIFDNAVDYKLISTILPNPQRGHILITSRNQNWEFQCISVDVFSLEEALRFFEVRLNIDGFYDKSNASVLAEELGYLPLALEHASAYMKNKGKTFEGYLRLFRSRKMELLKRADRPPDYHATVATTWNLSIAELQTDFPIAVDLLNFYSFFAPEYIPHGLMLDQMSSVLGQEVDELLLDDAIEALRIYSLISLSVGSSNLSIHRLVQEVVRSGLSITDYRKWLGHCFSMLDEVFKFDEGDTNTWVPCAEILPHALSVVEHAQVKGLLSIEVVPFLFNIGQYIHQSVANYALAKQLFQLCLSQWKEKGFDIPGTLYNDLGWCHRSLGEYDEAKMLLEEALRLDEKKYGANNIVVATRWNNLGLVFQDIGNLEEARRCLQKAYDITRDSLGGEHIETAIKLNNLGQLYKNLGELQLAKEFLLRALDIRKRVLGNDHPQVAVTLNNLGLIDQDLGERELSKEKFLAAVEITEKHYGEKHPMTAQFKVNLGGILRELGDLTESARLLKHSLLVWGDIYGDEHVQIAKACFNLGNTLQAMNDLESAKSQYLRAEAIYNKIAGGKHPDLVFLFATLGGVFTALGEYTEAKQYLIAGVEIAKQYYGEGHPNVVGLLNNLGNLLFHLKELEESFSIIKQAYVIQRDNFGEAHPDTTLIFDNLQVVGATLKKQRWDRM